jgi:hypothetical protein
VLIRLQIPDGYYDRAAAYDLEVLITYAQRGPHNGTVYLNRAGQEQGITLAPSKSD